MYLKIWDEARSFLANICFDVATHVPGKRPWHTCPICVHTYGGIHEGLRTCAKVHLVKLWCDAHIKQGGTGTRARKTSHWKV